MTIVRLVDGEWTDEGIKDPLEQMMALLNETRDRTLIQRWGLWLIKRDIASGLKVSFLHCLPESVSYAHISPESF